MKETHILVVDDNPEIREIIQILLTGEGFAVSEAKNGLDALEALRSERFDLIILDIMMPHQNGYQTCLEIRKISNTPILFLSAKTKDSDKTLGFSSGGDDYLAKPFSYNELISRAKALIRRYQVYKGKEDSKAPAAVRPIIYHTLRIEKDSGTVWKDNQPLDLTETEYSMLLLLIEHRNQIFSAARLYEAIWEEPYYYGANNTVMVHIRNLRKKIERDPQNPVLIKTVWGRGYRCDET